MGALFELIKGSAAQVFGVEKRAQVKVHLRIQQMNSHGRQIGALAILLGGVVGRKESRKRNHSVENGKGEEPSLPAAALDHPVATSVRTLGSAKYNNTSARRFPTTRKIVEHSTPPITTYKSRARMASSSSGPSPGQLITTSLISDLLRTAPILNQEIEIICFAAARSAYR